MKQSSMNFKIMSMVILVALMLVGCEYEQSSHQKASQQNEEAAKSLVENDTLPDITRSLERENIKRRVEFINQPDRVGYLYLLSEQGQLIQEVQVNGKISSLNSFLTPMEEIYSSSYGNLTLEAADVDGTWGENDNGVFWFTPDGTYQEWNGLYLYSSERMSFDVKPVLMEIE